MAKNSSEKEGFSKKSFDKESKKNKYEQTINEHLFDIRSKTSIRHTSRTESLFKDGRKQ